MANPAVRRLDEESIDHGDAEHATHVHLVDTYGGGYLAVRGGALDRDMLGDIVPVDEVEVSQVAELHLGRHDQLRVRCGLVYCTLAVVPEAIPYSPCSRDRTGDPAGLARDVLSLATC